MRYVAETPKVRGETFTFSMPRSKFVDCTRRSFEKHLLSVAKDFVRRRNYENRSVDVTVELLDYEVHEDYLNDIVRVSIVYDHRATVLDTTDKVLWNRHKLSNPELRFYTRP